VFWILGYERKFAFFVRETAVLYHKFHSPLAAHSLLVLVAKYYQCPEIDEHHSAISQRSMFQRCLCLNRAIIDCFFGF
jgi:hypothetical protein